jgi:DNA-binding transcriptional ArsR family regulator/ribosomal protein L20
MSEIVIKFHPIYEMLNSIQVYHQARQYKKSDFGETWIKSVNKQISPKLKEKLQDSRVMGEIEMLSLFLSIKDLSDQSKDLSDQSIETLIQWIEKLTKQEVFEALHPWISHDVILPENFNEVADILSKWNEQYFRHLNPNIIQYLHEDAEAKQKFYTANANSENVIEQVTNGFLVTGFHQVLKTLLIPRYHGGPIVGYKLLPRLHKYFYPIDIVEEFDSHEPPSSLVRLTQSLSDKNRLKIIKFIHEEPKSFTDIVNHIGLAKSTVHHHIVTLRSSGLVQIIFSPNKNERFTLRDQAISILTEQLEDYLE